MNTDTQYTILPSPIGDLMLAGHGRRLTLVEMLDSAPQPPAGWTRDDRALADARGQLAAYFAGELRDFDLELDPVGTPFDRSVWEAVSAIPYGTTTTYRELAAHIGRPTAVRAVGTANGRNPIPIVIPCHRVIGTDGTLRGYGGGLDRKRRLLELEARTGY
ncbi:MAG TPA: methylated-DNA--[protein]-cysteine S-methyltransferase [Gaiellaceae bacterium]|jgi:methylated-DNA-[protein]-cysteine S-methyltransferase